MQKVGQAARLGPEQLRTLTYRVDNLELAKEESGKPNVREQSKARHRAVLLDAAAEAVYRYGVRGVTVDRIQEISGLSRGMIGFHFGSKENLLIAMLEGMANDYTRNWRAAVDSGDINPSRRIRGIIAADFLPEVLNRRDITIWFAFRAELNTRPEYARFVDSRETEFRSILMSTCRELAASEAEAVLAANGLTALLEGMWTDFLLNPDSFSRSEATRTCIEIAKRLLSRMD